MNTPQKYDDFGQEKEDMALFNGNLLDKSMTEHLVPEGLIFRPLNSKDYNKGFLQLLSQLTDVGNVTEDQFLNRFRRMKQSGGYYVIVIEDTKCEKLIGSTTLVVEQKFIHNCTLRGRLEDVVVNNEYRGKQLGKLLVSSVMKLADQLHCYKLSLDCRDRLIPFYESLGFKCELGNANTMNVRYNHENPAEQSRL